MGQELSEHDNLNILLGGLGMSLRDAPVRHRENRVQRRYNPMAAPPARDNSDYQWSDVVQSMRNSPRSQQRFRDDHFNLNECRTRYARSMAQARAARDFVRDHTSPEILSLYAATNVAEVYYYGKQRPSGAIQVYYITRTYHDTAPYIFDRIRDHDLVDSKLQWFAQNAEETHLYVDHFATVNEGDNSLD